MSIGKFETLTISVAGNGFVIYPGDYGSGTVMVAETAHRLSQLVAEWALAKAAGDEAPEPTPDLPGAIKLPSGAEFVNVTDEGVTPPMKRLPRL